MVIRAFYVQHFRSIENSCLSRCGGLNILIGKNNAGKSNLLSAIELMLAHLKGERITGTWPQGVPVEAQFTDRDISRPVRFGIEFVLPHELNNALREQLIREAPHLERSIEQLGSHRSIAFVLASGTLQERACLFIEQITAGRLTLMNGDLSTDGMKLLSVPTSVGIELYRNHQRAGLLRDDLNNLERISSLEGREMEFLLEAPPERRSRVLLRDLAYSRLARRHRRAPSSYEPSRDLEELLLSVRTRDELLRGTADLIAKSKEKIDSIEKSDTSATLSAFAGETARVPDYAEWLVHQFGNLPYLHIEETKQPLGRAEAETLLQLKVRRGGPERLVTIQETIRALLGVNVDAFESESRGEDAAEMDVDEFLVEANGAGIREALRIILDLEMKQPQLVLIEEPEVHLHPGLSRVVAAYLREKSSDMQMFVATHSTEFVDTVSFQDVFLVYRNPQNKTSCDTVGIDEAVERIPEELGLRLSTMFMFDRLVFVEGSSDENILRELAKKRAIDLAGRNVGFVYMNGVRNFAHFAAEGTLSLLSRRRIRMWFVVDRDEAEDAEIERMIERLGDRAVLTVLSRRELENYLLDASAICKFVEEKHKLAGSGDEKPTVNQMRAALQEEAAQLREEVCRLRLERRSLKPVFLHTRRVTGTIEERIRHGIEELNQRRNRLQEERDRIAAEAEQEWEANALGLVPASLLLQRVANRFGATFSKEKGDSERLARLLARDMIASELTDLLQSIGGPS